MKKALIYIGIFGLMLRLLLCWQMSGVAAVQAPNVATDMATYLRLSSEICQGQWPDHYDYQPFYYTVFLPFCRLLSGGRPWGIMLLQSLLGGVAIVLAGIGGARLFGRKAGIAAASLLALDRIHVFYTPFALFEVLQSFWMVLVLCLGLKCLRDKRDWSWLLLAFVLSLATLTRGNALLLLPGMLALLIWNHRAQKLKAGLLAVLMVLIFELPQLPYALRNYRYTGRWCGASTAGEKVLALGNTPEAPPGGLEYPLTYHRWVADSDRRPQEGRISVRNHILSWAKSEPLVFLELKFRAMMLFWDREEIPNNVSLSNEGQASFLTRLPMLLPFGLIGTFALFGMFLAAAKCRREFSPGLLLLLYMTVTIWFATALFYNLARFRLTIIPLLCILGGAVFEEIEWKMPEKAQVAAALRRWLLPALLSIFVVNSFYPTYQSFVEPAFMRMARPNGVVAAFHDTTLIYDHGPLNFGGFRFIGIPDGGLKIRKRLAIPESCRNRPATLRLPVFLNANSSPSAILEVNGSTHYLDNSRLVKDRFMTWLEIQVPKIDGGNGVAEITWSFPPASNLGIGIDQNRDYGRTDFLLPDGSVLPMYSEAAVEAQFEM